MQLLLVSDADKIRAVIPVSNPTAVIEAFPAIKGGGRVISIDYDVRSNSVVWVETDTSNTSRFVLAFFNGTERTAFSQSGRVQGLSFDWTANLIYYTQPDFGRICVSNMTGSSCVVVIDTSDEQPLSLVIVPEIG